MHSPDSNSANFQNDQVWAKKLVPLPPTNFDSGCGAAESTESFIPGGSDPFCCETTVAPPAVEPRQEVDTDVADMKAALAMGPVVEIVGQSDIPSEVASLKDEDPFVNFDRALAEYTIPVEPTTPAGALDESVETRDSNLGPNLPNDPAEVEPVATVGINDAQSSPSVDLNAFAADPFDTAAPLESTWTEPSDDPAQNVSALSESATPLEPAEMHEFDLAMKVLNTPDDSILDGNTTGKFGVASESATDNPALSLEHGNSHSTENTPANDTMADGTDTDRYLEPPNVPAFVPGVTPIDAYPVCKDFLQNHAAAQTAVPTELKTLATAITSIPVKTAELEDSAAEASEQTEQTETAAIEPATETPATDPLLESVEESIIQLQSMNQLDSATNDSVDSLASLSLPELGTATENTDSFAPAVDALKSAKAPFPVSEPVVDELPPTVDAPAAEATTFAGEPNLETAEVAQLEIESNADETAVTNLAQDDDTFLAEPDQVIQVDGNDGFDFIDLACFDVAHAMFGEGQIFLDDGNGTKFQIEYHNIDTAVFANGIEIELA
jgi:hypothetical protein